MILYSISVPVCESLMILYTEHPVVICLFFLFHLILLLVFHVHVCVIDTHVFMHTYAHVCGGPLVARVFLDGSPFSQFRPGLSVEPRDH